MAHWLTEPDTRASALLSRMMVNRVWQALFGRGIVATSRDFGRQGTPPTHPELLEWLTVEFQQGGWHLKPVIRTIVTSGTYRQSSRPGPEHLARGLEKDPDNYLLWKMPLRRLESEAVRDSMLAISGHLQSSMGGPPVPQIATPDGHIRVDVKQLQNKSEQWKRSVYHLTRRGYSLTLLDAFDQPSIETTCSIRQTNAVPLQSLTMLNDEFVFGQANSLAKRVRDRQPADEEQTVKEIYRVILCRNPDAQELQLCVDVMIESYDEFKSMDQDDDRARFNSVTQICHTLLNTSEFLYRE